MSSLSLTVGAAAVTPQVSAQDTVRSALLEEVVVTAQRKEESAQDVAISITVFDQEQIANANMTNSNDIATYTPSLTTNTRFGPENATFSIRGFTRSLRTTASVGVYFAEVIAPRGQTSQTSGDGAGPGSLFDLANVQVLKGPQGTLFGRNTTGGSILLVPNKPSDEFEAYVEFSESNYSSSRQQAVANFSLTDTFHMRFGVDHNERDGHLNNITNIGADKLGNVDYTAFRLSAVWDINESMENYTILTDVDSDTAGYTSRLFACNNESNND
ncbi:TonB-dependent receptor plug domain-containing protein, partial [Litorivivens sp.]